MDERRRLGRFKMCIPMRVVICCDDGHSKEVLEVRSANICSGGTYFETKHSIPVGAEVFIDFVVPVGKLDRVDKYSYVQVKGKVIRAENGGVAVQFEKSYEMLPFRNV